MKKLSVSVVVAVVVCFFMMAEVATAASQQVVNEPISYIFSGAKKRVDKCIIHFQSRGGSVEKNYTEEIIGNYNGKFWPGVSVRRKDAPDGEGIWIPVSDSALRKGLCSDQTALLDGLPLFREVSSPSASAPPLPPTVSPVECQDLPFKKGGFWSSVSSGEYAEVKQKPDHYKVSGWRVDSGDTVHPVFCFRSTTLPTTEMIRRHKEGTWIFVREWLNGDGGTLKTILLRRR